MYNKIINKLGERIITDIQQYYKHDWYIHIHCVNTNTMTNIKNSWDVPFTQLQSISLDNLSKVKIPQNNEFPYRMFILEWFKYGNKKALDK